MAEMPRITANEAIVKFSEIVATAFFEFRGGPERLSITRLQLQELIEVAFLKLLEMDVMNAGPRVN